MPGLSSLLAVLFLKQFLKGLVRSVSPWLAAGNAAD